MIDEAVIQACCEKIAEEHTATPWADCTEGFRAAVRRDVDLILGVLDYHELLKVKR